MKVYPNKCVDRPACPNYGQCYEPSICDNATGECPEVWKKDGTPCDDRQTDTHRDICIEGRCVGDPFREPTFQTMGQGDCIDVMPRLRSNDVVVDHSPMPRYYVDAFDEKVCEEQCRNDPEC